MAYCLAGAAGSLLAFTLIGKPSFGPTRAGAWEPVDNRCRTGPAAGNLIARQSPMFKERLSKVFMFLLLSRRNVAGDDEFILVRDLHRRAQRGYLDVDFRIHRSRGRQHLKHLWLLVDVESEPADEWSDDGSQETRQAGYSYGCHNQRDRSSQKRPDKWDAQESQAQRRAQSSQYPGCRGTELERRYTDAHYGDEPGGAGQVSVEREIGRNLDVVAKGEGDCNGRPTDADLRCADTEDTDLQQAEVRQEAIQ